MVICGDRRSLALDLTKLRLGSLIVVHTSIALPDSSFGKPITAVFFDKKQGRLV